MFWITSCGLSDITAVGIFQPPSTDQSDGPGEEESLSHANSAWIKASPVLMSGHRKRKMGVRPAKQRETRSCRANRDLSGIQRVAASRAQDYSRSGRVGFCVQVIDAWCSHTVEVDGKCFPRFFFTFDVKMPTSSSPFNNVFMYIFT